MIEKLRTSKGNDIYSDDGTKALDVAALKISCKWEHGKAPKVGLNRPHFLAVWNKSKVIINHNTKTWAVEDQVELNRLNTDVINISETEVTRQTGKVLNGTISVLSIYSQDQSKQL